MKNNDVKPPERTPWSTIETHCRGILSAIPTAAYACDRSGLITYFNPLAAEVWGRAPKLRDASDRYCGSHKLYSLGGAPIRHDECWMALALLEGKTYHGREIVLERLDCTHSIGEAYAHPLRGEQGEVVGAVNLVVDITGRKGGKVGCSKPHRASNAYAAAVAMIDIAVSVLTAMRWESATFG